jgi:hypothetical protein
VVPSPQGLLSLPIWTVRTIQFANLCYTGGRMKHELCHATAKILISDYPSAYPAVKDAMHLRHITGVLVSAQVQKSDEGISVQGRAHCLGWCPAADQKTGKPAVANADFCLAKRIKELKLEKKVPVNGDCARDTRDS